MGEPSRTFGRKRVPGVADVIDTDKIFFQSFAGSPLENKVDAFYQRAEPDVNPTVVVCDIVDCLRQSNERRSGWAEIRLFGPVRI